MPTRALARFLLPLALILIPASAFSASLAVPGLELITRGHMSGAAFVLDSRFFVQLDFDGGFKFGGKISFFLNSGSVESDLATQANPPSALTGSPTTTDLQLAFNSVIDYLGATTTLGLKGASITMRDIFDWPIDFNYFIGQYDVFCSGTSFPVLFGTRNIASAFRGYMYFPTGVGGNSDMFYDGIYAVNGTGIGLSTHQINDSFQASVYLYQDSAIASKGVFSFDTRFLINTSSVKMEFFAGASFPASLYGIYRTGLLFYFTTGSFGEFIAQVGIPYWDPANPDFNIDNLYFLFEPRVSFGIVNIIFTYFYHPMYYLQKKFITESNASDINLNLMFGQLQTDGMQGGIEFTASIRGSPFSTMDFFSARVSPYFSVIASSVQWDFKLTFNAFPFNANNLFVAYLGVRTGF